MEKKNPDLILDPNTWGKLHPELIEQVLSKLPFSSIVRFRAVCKHWNYLIQSPLLAPRCQLPKPVLLYHHSGGIRGHNNIWMGSLLAFFNSNTNTWERRALSFVGSRSLVASDEGLLCFSSKSDPETFLVCNPLTKKWREIELYSSVLPAVPRGAIFKNPFNHMLVGMVMNQETGHYKLVVAGIHNASSSPTQVYDSRSSCWKTSAPVPKLTSVLENGDWHCAGKSVHFGGNLYWLVRETVENEEEVVKAVVKYNVEQEKWTVAQESSPSTLGCSFQITAINGGVMLLNWGDDHYWGYVNGVPTELLDLGSEMRQMDAKMVDLVFMDDETLPVWSVGQGDLLYIVYEYGRHKKGPKILVYDHTKGSHTWLPTWTHLREQKSFWAFTPSLRAFV